MLVFVRIAVIADSSDDKAGKFVHQTCSLHLDTQYFLFSKKVPHAAVLDNSITGADEAIVYDRSLSLSAIAVNKLSDVATLTSASFRRSVLVLCFE